MSCYLVTTRIAESRLCQLIFTEVLPLPGMCYDGGERLVFVYWKTMNTIKQKLFYILSAVRTRHNRGGGGGEGSLRNIVKRSEDSGEVREVREDLPEIITPSQVIRREVGGTAILACSVENLGQYVVMWKQEGRVISGQIRLLTPIHQQLIIAAGSLLVRKDARMRLSVTETEFSLYLSALTLEVERQTKLKYFHS